jgi:hypothetical protein
VPGVWLHEVARPRRLPDLPGYDAEREAGPDPCKAAVPALPAAPSECRMRGCGQRSRCPAEGCDRPHHVALHGVLKAGKSSPLEGNTDLPDEFTSSVGCGTPETARQLRGLLEGLGIDPSALEIRIGVREAGEPGWPCGGDITDPGAAKAGVGRLTGRLMEALTSLCQAGERFVDSAAENRQRMIGVADPTVIPRRSVRRDRRQISGQERGVRAKEGQRLDGVPRARQARWGGWR